MKSLVISNSLILAEMTHNICGQAAWSGQPIQTVVTALSSQIHYRRIFADVIVYIFAH